MAHTVTQLAKQFHDILKAEPGPAGRQKVCDVLREALKDKDFIDATITDGTSDRHLLYEDAELGFCIFAHHYRGAKDSPPHDHGPAWAIYGQAVGETKMRDWQLLEPASAEKAGKVKLKKEYSLTPGMAYVYNEGDLHSPHRASSTKLIRIEGLNMDRVKRLKFEAV